MLNLFYSHTTYGKNPKYWYKRAWANSVDPDQTPQNAASDQSLHCLPLIQQYLDTSKLDVQVLEQVW